MTISQKDMKEFKSAFLTADTAHVNGVLKAKETIGEKEDSFQIAVIDLGHSKLGNKRPTQDEAAILGEFLANAKAKLPDGDKRKIANDKATISTLKSRLKSLIWCGAHNCKAELEVELTALMASYAKKNITGKKVQIVRQSLYGARMRNDVEGADTSVLATAAKKEIYDKAMQSITDKTVEDKRRASLTAVERAAELILVSMSRAMAKLSPTEVTAFDDVRKSLEVLSPTETETETETPEPPVPSVPAPVAVPATAEKELVDLFGMMQTKIRAMGIDV